MSSENTFRNGTRFGQYLGRWLWEEAGNTVADFDAKFKACASHLGLKALADYRENVSNMTLEESGAIFGMFCAQMDGIGRYLAVAYEAEENECTVADMDDSILPVPENIGAMVCRYFHPTTKRGIEHGYEKAKEAYLKDCDPSIDELEGRSGLVRAV